jgi:hypothetical protein
MRLTVVLTLARVGQNMKALFVRVMFVCTVMLAVIGCRSTAPVAQTSAESPVVRAINEADFARMKDTLGRGLGMSLRFSATP